MLLMRNEGEDQAGEEHSHTCCPNGQHNCLSTHMSGSVISLKPTLMANVFERKSGIKIEAAENNHRVCSKVQEPLKESKKRTENTCHARNWFMSAIFNHINLVLW